MTAHQNSLINDIGVNQLDANQRAPLQTTHKKLVSVLSLVNQAYAADDLKGHKDNPLDPVNDIHDRLKKFLNAHSGFNRDSLQDYLNLFAFVWNPPNEGVET